VNAPVEEKPKSFKMEGTVEAIVHNNLATSCRGKILIYLIKEPGNEQAPGGSIQLKYGDKILLCKKLQRIKNSGNPGAFNYEQYAAFQQIFHHVFLKEADWVKLDAKNPNWFKQFIFTTRESILSILQKNIPAGKDELGIAEALLIGYTHDLDKDLVQAYSNTGVVHIIAISGMHLGLIYLLLVSLFAKLPLVNKSTLIQVVLILTSLWIFSLLTGAAASVVRSAVMFTFIAVGKVLSKQSLIYNSLAASAFVMLCYNPFFLWDVGFQLSYLAVIGIVVFQKPIYNWLYIKNKWVNEIWKLVAVSLAAQVLTFPICIYYFHQFPNLFLLSNIIAVPLSGLILYLEIALVTMSFISLAGFYIGKVVAWLVWLMNRIILWIDQLPFAVWDNIPSDIASTFLLYIVIFCIATWLLNKNRNGFHLALAGLFGFLLLQAIGNWQIKKQLKIVVYNVPQYQAIDFVMGNHYRFLGDSILLADGELQNFHLKPARISLQLSKRVDSLTALFQKNPFYQLGSQKILVVNKPLQFEPLPQKIEVDIIIISKNPRIDIAQMAGIFNCRKYIFDASNTVWRINEWQKECKALNLNFHTTPTDGAFIVDIGM
jgi:competence protein ComEC